MGREMRLSYPPVRSSSQTEVMAIYDPQHRPPTVAVADCLFFVSEQAVVTGNQSTTQRHAEPHMGNRRLGVPAAVTPPGLGVTAGPAGRIVVA